MILEFAEGGDLATLIANMKRRSEALDEEKVWHFWLPIIRVCAYLHDRKIIHRDIKALNVFLTARKEVKVGDFGVGRVMSDNTLMVDTMYGTPLYLSPELCQNEPYNSKTDIWSCGVLLYELCALDTPFPGNRYLCTLGLGCAVVLVLLECSTPLSLSSMPAVPPFSQDVT